MKQPDTHVCFCDLDNTTMNSFPTQSYTADNSMTLHIKNQNENQRQQHNYKALLNVTCPEAPGIIGTVTRRTCGRSCMNCV